MQKTITIDEKEIVLKTNALTPLIYKKEFKRDFFADVMSMGKDNFDTEILYNLLWLFAKTADNQLPSMWEWLEGIETLPIMEYSEILMELTTICISSSKTLKKTQKATKR